MLKIEDVKVGDELVCIDREYFSEKMEGHYFSDDRNILKISTIHAGNVWVGEYCIPPHELKYFKKKEQSQYTFDDLIDVAVQANNDRVINGFTVVGEKLNCQTLDGEEYNLGIGCEVSHGIKYLQSLYKETFVIECEEDIKRIKHDAFITLANGLACRFNQYANAGLMLLSDGSFYHTHFITLKGATVEQSK